MKKLILLFLLMGSSLYWWHTKRISNCGAMPDQKYMLKVVAKEIVENNISKIELYYVPPYIQLVLALTPQRLFTGKPLEISTSDTHKLKKISEALQKTTPINKIVRTNTRVGIIVYNTRGQKRLMVAVGRNGGGVVNDTECILNGPLYHTLVSISEKECGETLSFKKRVLRFVSAYF